MIKSLLNIGIASCSYCGNFWIEKMGLCNRCYKGLSYFKNENGLFIQNTACFGLLNWFPNKSDLLNSWIPSLKGDDRELIWKEIALELFSNNPIVFHEKNLVFIPAPSKNGGKDHAYFLAKSLSELYGGRLLSPFIRPNHSEHRNLGRAERLKVYKNRIQVEKKRNDIKESETAVFVDDIITTGSTLKAASQALGRPVKGLVLAIRK